MTLWHLMAAICFLTSVMTSLESAQLLHVGIKGYFFAAVIGLLVGTFSVLAMWRMAAFALAMMETRSDQDSSPVWSFSRVCFAGTIWALITGFLGSWISSKLLGVLH